MPAGQALRRRCYVQMLDIPIVPSLSAAALKDCTAVSLFIFLFSEKLFLVYPVCLQRARGNAQLFASDCPYCAACFFKHSSQTPNSTTAQSCTTPFWFLTSFITCFSSTSASTTPQQTVQYMWLCQHSVWSKRSALPGMHTRRTRPASTRLFRYILNSC